MLKPKLLLVSVLRSSGKVDSTSAPAVMVAPLNTVMPAGLITNTRPFAVSAPAIRVGALVTTWLTSVEFVVGCLTTTLACEPISKLVQLLTTVGALWLMVRVRESLPVVTLMPGLVPHCTGSALAAGAGRGAGTGGAACACA